MGIWNGHRLTILDHATPFTTLLTETDQPPPSGEEDKDSSFHVYRDFHNFNEFVWHDPLYLKIHQAMKLRTISINLRLGYLYRLTSNSGLLEFMDRMFNFFPRLRELTVYSTELPESFYGSRWYRLGVPYPLSLMKEMGQLEEHVQLTSMETYEERSGGTTLGVGFECHWMGKDGKERCFIMEKRNNEGWRRLQRRVDDSSALGQ